jgi:hypothetical protein
MLMILVGSLSFLSGVYFNEYLNKKMFHKTIYSNEGWLPISSFSENEKDYLVTDGEVVAYDYFPDYNKDGKIIFSYQKRIATHWRRLPLPPKV